ncbi:C-type lectin (CTL) or carbohydrate-recognition domain (CRD) [Dermatophagoides farinae]|uniref:C-type lectin (CTL) or carbohydrate-recognition domain (CRD) n=1 Tax=Dermatophagoides farinae TaxID=6954 RepID=A0A922I156_DERFA|nr:C-type lectin (CTL) or carbohydrate-recognition domain (CRD) [Dermatophagoides farinae]
MFLFPIVLPYDGRPIIFVPFETCPGFNFCRPKQLLYLICKVENETKLIYQIHNLRSQTISTDNFLHCPEDWRREGIYCYRFFNLRHSWRRAAQICRR